MCPAVTAKEYTLPPDVWSTRTHSSESRSHSWDKKREIYCYITLYKPLRTDATKACMPIGWIQSRGTASQSCKTGNTEWSTLSSLDIRQNNQHWVVLCEVGEVAQTYQTFCSLVFNSVTLPPPNSFQTIQRPPPPPPPEPPFLYWRISAGPHLDGLIGPTIEVALWRD